MGNQDEEEDKEEEEDGNFEDIDSDAESSSGEEIAKVEELKVDEETEGCKHYRTRCEQQCITCNRWYTCRLCHDAIHYDTEYDPKKNHQFPFP